MDSRYSSVLEVSASIFHLWLSHVCTVDEYSDDHPVAGIGEHFSERGIAIVTNEGFQDAPNNTFFMQERV